MNNVHQTVVSWPFRKPERVPALDSRVHPAFLFRMEAELTHGPNHVTCTKHGLYLYFFFPNGYSARQAGAVNGGLLPGLASGMDEYLTFLRVLEVARGQNITDTAYLEGAKMLSLLGLHAMEARRGEHVLTRDRESQFIEWCDQGAIHARRARRKAGAEARTEGGV